MIEAFKKRIGYWGDLKDISLGICKQFRLGSFLSNKLVLMGYEDFNFSLETTSGKYFVKVFSNFRTDKDCERYVNIMLNAMESGVSIPKLYKSQQGYLCKLKINDSDLRLCIMEHVEGKTILSAREKLSDDEIRFIARQASLIDSINMKPYWIYDTWAITNFLKEYQKKWKYLSEEDLELIKPLVKEFKDLKIEELPHCFVHGDILTTNVMKDNNEKLWIIDFAVSNYYPRIQELAVLACDLLFDPKDKKKSDHNLMVALEEYQKKIQLTGRELKVLPTYIRLAHAMHLLRANYEKIVGKNTFEENEHFINQGRFGLKQMLG